MSHVSKENIDQLLEKKKAERDRILAQRNSLVQRNQELAQQDQELAKQLIRLDGEVLSLMEVADLAGE